jgi:hypothetical protein
MTLTIFEGKLKCACCNKIIPVSKVFMIEKAVDGLQEVKINHLCLPCHNYKQQHKSVRVEVIVHL